MDFIVRPLLRRPFVLSRLVRCLCGPCETNDVASTASLGDSQQKITALLPSQTFLAGLSLSEKNHVEKIIEELEIYLWMSPRPPLYLDDELWYRLMKQEDLRARLTCLKMFSVAQHKDLRALERKKLEQEEFSKHVEKEQEKFMRGEMAYGSGFYQLVSSPLRNRKRCQQIQGARVWRTLRLCEKPRIVFDMQYLASSTSFRERSSIGLQLQYTISENFNRNEPFPLTFANFSKDLPSSQDFISKYVGFYGGAYTSQTILPDFLSSSPKDLYSKDDIVYISRHARQMLDGPLKSDVYVICASWDDKKESLGATRKGCYRSARLPLDKYLRWKSGGKAIPFPNILRILDEVYTTNGDWETALKNHVSQRHWATSDEVLRKRAELHKMKRKNLDEMVQMIQEITANKK